MDDTARLVALTQALRRQAVAGQERRLLLLAGDRAWCQACAEACLAALALARTLWIGERAPAGSAHLELSQGLQLLGREYELLVLDAHGGLDPDVFAAAAGTVVGGGLLFLLAPDLDRWPAMADPQLARIRSRLDGVEDRSGRFLARLARQLPLGAGVVTVRQGAAIEEVPVADVLPRPPGWIADGRYRTEEQREAVAAILHAATGHHRRPLVLSADRGRGKSAAFGLAAAELLLAGKRRILVTAPRREAVDTLFEQARRHLPGAQQAPGSLAWEGGRLEFQPPDVLLREAMPADLLLVDEAAGIPLAMLAQLLRRYRRIAFATTVHGYEGTGRGFALKFHALLGREAPGWQLLELCAPIRWVAGDPVEATVNRVLLLDADIAAEADVVACDPARTRWERLDRDRLAGDEETLRQLFGLLVLAHYRTRPFDLYHLLDASGLEVHALRYEGRLVATALLAREGGLDAALAASVFRGERRVQGHLLPQSLVANLGLEAAGPLRYGRILRIAVHPQLQGRGLGSRLLACIEDEARRQGLDCLGSSFGLAPELLDFWQGNGYRPVRIGMRREASSGACAALLLRPLSAAAASLVTRAQQRFARQLPWLLADSHRNLEVELLRRLWPPADGDTARLGEDEWRELEAFAHARRGYEDSALAIERLLHTRLAAALAEERLSEPQCAVLLRRVLQHQDWGEIARALRLAGRAATQQLLREAVGVLLDSAARPAGKTA